MSLKSAGAGMRTHLETKTFTTIMKELVADKNNILIQK